MKAISKSVAKRIGLSTRQVRRLAKAYHQQGAKGLIHSGRGKVSNRTIAADIKERSLAFVREHYHDFGPTFAAEKYNTQGIQTIKNSFLFLSCYD